MSTISLTKISSGILHDFSDDLHPTMVYGISTGTTRIIGNNTSYGFVQAGSVVLKTNHGDYKLSAGQYFSVTDDLVIEGDESAAGYVAVRLGYIGLFSIGGKIEKKGRLPYIDGCSDSVLVSPPVIGDPCLNMLCIPTNIDQTAHTHPSLRIGVVVDGRGICRTPEGDIEMRPGHIFVLGIDAVHSFHTEDSHLQIVVYHPDSDTGPSPEDHPMINRSYVNGVSAVEISSIHTKAI